MDELTQLKRFDFFSSFEVKNAFARTSDVVTQLSSAYKDQSILVSLLGKLRDYSGNIVENIFKSWFGPECEFLFEGSSFHYLQPRISSALNCWYASVGSTNNTIILSLAWAANRSSITPLQKRFIYHVLCEELPIMYSASILCWSDFHHHVTSLVNDIKYTSSDEVQPRLMLLQGKFIDAYKVTQLLYGKDFDANMCEFLLRSLENANESVTREQIVTAHLAALQI